MNKRCHAKATLRRSGKMYLDVPVTFVISVEEMLVAYLLAKDARSWISATEDTHLSTLPIPATKSEAMNAVTETLKNYGTDFYTREEELPEGWEENAHVLNIRAKLTELFGF